MSLLLALLIACGPAAENDPSVSDTADDTDTADTTDTDIPAFPNGVSTLAGSGQMANIDGLGVEAAFNEPKAMALGPDGALYVGGGDGAIRRITMEGEVSTLSLSGPSRTESAGMAIDAQGAIYVSDAQQHCIHRIQDGVAEVFAGSCGTAGMADGPEPLLSRPRGMAFDAEGNLILADSENMRIRSIDPDGVASTVAGIGGYGGPSEGPVDSAGVYYPLAVAIHPDGSVFFTGLDNCVRRVAEGQVEDIAGLCQNYSSEGREDGAADQARFFAPYGIAFDSQGRLIVSDSFNSRTRVLSADLGQVSTLTGSIEGYADGSLDEALFDLTRGIVIDAGDNLFVADSVNHRIRVVVE